MLTFSSAIIIVKLLTDKHEIDALMGASRSDILVVLVMIGGGIEEKGLTANLLTVALKSTVFLAGVGIMMRVILPPLLDRMAFTQELLVLFAVAWGVSLASLGDALGFSKELGAFVAGVSLAASLYRNSIGARLASWRDLALALLRELGGAAGIWASLRCRRAQRRRCRWSCSSVIRLLS